MAEIIVLDDVIDAGVVIKRILERKGRIRRLPNGTACGGGCNKCHPQTVELYEWSDQPA